MRRFWVFLCILAALLSLGTFSAFADEDIEKEYSSFIDGLPDSLTEKLPQLGAGDAVSDAEALTAAWTW